MAPKQGTTRGLEGGKMLSSVSGFPLGGFIFGVGQCLVTVWRGAIPYLFDLLAQRRVCCERAIKLL